MGEMSTWLVLVLVSAYLGAAGAQSDCGINVFPLTIFPSKPCKLRVTKADLNACNAELEDMVVEAKEKGEEMAKQLLEHEQRVSELPGVPLSTPEYHHYLTNTATQEDRRQVRKALLDLANVTALGMVLSQRCHINPKDLGDLIISLKVPVEPSGDQQVPTCNASDIYRTYNASCNNLKFPTWAMAGTAYTRLRTPVYNDGINEPKKSVTGKDLPNARRLRKILFPTGEFNDKTNTLMTMQFGQMIAHDTSLSADWLGFDGLGIECCSYNATPLPPENYSIGCYQNEIPKDDEYYARKGVTCISVARSMKLYTMGGYQYPAQGMNTINGLLDCSFSYGNDKERADLLREFQKGQLRTQTLPNGRKVLPQNDNPIQSCSLPMNGTCFFAGDARVNQNTQLTALHNMFLGEHNRLANELSSINPHWDDEKMYQETRRIIIALYQHMIYNEYLPQVEDKYWLEKFHLIPSKTGYSNCYNESINPGTMIPFNHAMFRIFHGTAQSDLHMYKDIGCPVGKIKIGRWMDKPEILVQDDNMDKFTLGLTQQPATKDDKYTVYELNNNLFRVDSPYGQDLDMFDIIRSRDNGLGSLNDYREVCGLKRAKTFKDFSDTIPYEDTVALSKVYEHPDDVEAMMMMLEKQKPGRLTVRDCVMLEQFHRWKCADRFFYDYEGSPYPFTEDQLKEIKKVTISRLICNTSANITRIQRNGFKLISKTNPVVDCKDLPAVDLSFWRENK